MDKPAGRCGAAPGCLRRLWEKAACSLAVTPAPGSSLKLAVRCASQVSLSSLTTSVNPLLSNQAGLLNLAGNSTSLLALASNANGLLSLLTNPIGGLLGRRRLRLA